jgi:hypothetical protein
VAVIGLAIRFRVVSAQLNAKTVKSWRGGRKGGSDIENAPATHENPSLSLRVNRIIHKQNGVGEIAVKV